MIVLVATWTRSGSTFLCEALGGLMSTQYKHFKADTRPGIPIGDDVVSKLNQYPPGTLLKTHSFTIQDAGPALNAMRDTENGTEGEVGSTSPDNPPGLGLVSIRRDFGDCVVSNLLYMRHCRTVQKLPLPPAIQEMITAFPGLDDRAWLNLVILTRREWVQRQARQWSVFNHDVPGLRGLCTLEYADCIDDHEGMLKKLIETLGLSPSPQQYDDALERMDLENMKQRYNNKPNGNKVPFVREGRTNSARRFLDPAALDVLAQVQRKH